MKTVILDKVGNPDIKFKFIVEGEWDFNVDLAGDENQDSPLRWLASHPKFEDALFQFASETILQRTDPLLDRVKRVSVIFDPAIQQVWDKYVTEDSDRARKIKQKRLEKARAQVQKLEAELSE